MFSMHIHAGEPRRPQLEPQERLSDYRLQQVRSSEQAADGKQILSDNLANLNEIPPAISNAD